MSEDESPTAKKEIEEDLLSSVSSIAGIIGVVPKVAELGLKKELSRSLKETPNQVQGFPFDHEYLKKLISNQANTIKIRPVFLTLSGLLNSGKTEAILQYIDHYVDKHPQSKLSSKSYNQETEGIACYELFAAGFYPLRHLTIAEFTNESGCAFGILSTFCKEIQAHKEVPLFKKDLDTPTNDVFEDSNLENHLRYLYKYFWQCEQVPKEPDFSNKKYQFADHLCKSLPSEAALVNIWDLSLDKKALCFLAPFFGQFYNSHSWLFLDIELVGDHNNLDHHTRKDGIAWLQPHLYYLLHWSRMSESNPRESPCTIFVNHVKTTSNGHLRQMVITLKAKIKQAAKHIGASSLIEQKIETINLSDHDASNLLNQKFEKVIYETPYEDVPLSWLFLRSLLYTLEKIAITKSELRKKANECGLCDDLITKFCQFCTASGSILDLSLVKPDCHYVILKPINFLKSLDKILCPGEHLCQQYPMLINGIFPEKTFQSVFGENCPAFVDALSINLATKVPSSQLDMPNVDYNECFYFIPLSRKAENLIREADTTAVHLIFVPPTVNIIQQATLADYLLRSLPTKLKLVPCSNLNQMIIKECSTGTTITLVSHGPVTTISISQASPDVCSLILKVYNKIAETSKVRTKYKFVKICSKSIVTDIQHIPSCQYHVLPNDTLCDDCVRVNDQLKAWNEALREHPIPQNYIPNEELKCSDPTKIAKELTSCTPEVIKYLAEALEIRDVDTSSVSELISIWNERVVESTSSSKGKIEPRRMLARKLVEVGAKFCTSLDSGRKFEAESTFETLARKLDIYAPTIKQLQTMTQHITEQDNEDTYEKYSQEDGVISFKAVKWNIGPPQKYSEVEVKTETKDAKVQFGLKMDDADIQFGPETKDAESQFEPDTRNSEGQFGDETKIANIQFGPETKDVPVQIEHIIPNISPILFAIYTLFLLFICLSAMRGRTKLIAPLPGIEVLASTRLLVAGGQPNQLHWKEYGLKLSIPHDALPPGFLAEIVVWVTLSGPFVYPDSESWTPASAVYWISSSKDFINPVQLGLWHSAKGLQNGSDLRIVTAQDEAQNGMYIFEDIASKNYKLEGSFVYLYVNHFSIYCSLSNQLKYDGCLLYRKSPKSSVTWEYSLIVHKHHPDGVVQRLLDKASYTGWAIDIPDFTVEFEQDSNILTLNTCTNYSISNLNGWEIAERISPLMYSKYQIDCYESIRSNMQFLLIWTGKGLRTTQIIRLSLHGAEQPNVISFVTNSEDNEGNKVRGASGGFISSSENLLLYTNHVYQVLLFCNYLGINNAKCKMIEHERPNDLEQQKVAVLSVWLEERERTWRDFIRALALMKQCVIAKKLTKEHHVYFFNADEALKTCNDLNED